MDIAGSTALVTGGALRIGEAICRALAAEGCNVVIHYDRSQARAERLAELLRTEGVKAWTVPGHFGDGADPGLVVDRAWNESGRVNILVNNASVFHKEALLDASPADIREELDVNLVAPILLSRHFARLLLGESAEAGGELGIGHIVNLLDQRIMGNQTGCVPYLVSKKGLADFTRAAAREWAPQIVVNGVAPGAILPPVTKAGALGLGEPMGEIPLCCQCAPEDVAEAVIYLLQSSSMTGQLLFVDGGQNLLG